MLNCLNSLSNRNVLLILISIAILSSGASLLVNLTGTRASFTEWSESWLQNFSTEMFGAFLTFILIELIVGGRDKRLEEEKARHQKKENLIRDLRTGGDIAKRATEELRADGKLHDGTLEHEYMGGVDLQKADWLAAKLHGADLRNAKLQQAILSVAMLQQAILTHASLQRAHLEYANLQHAVLLSTNLQQANLREANLKGAFLHDANLQDADLTDTQFDEETILPDGTNWTPDTDMRRFTDPDHPRFWRSDHPGSPAYRDKTGG